MGMVQEGNIAAARAKFFPVQPCDYCKSTPALLFCPVDTAFMCITCDAMEHDEARGGGKHGRVWLCEVCEQVPAAVTCKADAAALCVSCDGDIHSANTLSGRHERIPVIPFHGPAESVVMMSAAAYSVLQPPAEDGYVPDSWVNKLTAAENGDSKSMEFFFQDPDQFLDFDHYQIPSQPFGDSIVPVQTIIAPADVPVHDHPSENHFRIDFTGPNSSSSHSAPSLSHSLSSSSMEIGVVPDGGSFSEISHPLARNLIKSTSSQVVGMDREARVSRYREKRKNRKFEKTIRYASRKAYADSRPRIKGRFAKQTESDPDTDRIFGAGAVSFITDARYGVVPSF